MKSLSNKIARRLSAAVTYGKIVPHFQPIISLSNRKIVGFEVLARWHDPVVGNVSPAVFIPLIEQRRLLDTLLDSLMSQALTAACTWRKSVFLAFNVSPMQLHNASLPERIASAAAAAGFPLSRIHIEITETAIIEDEARANAMLQQLIGMGCHVVMDDFGTGYSSLTWLRNLPFSKIKIDTTFVRSMITQKESRKIVNAVVGLGHSLGLSIVAEGVETAEQAELLRRIGCGFARGFLFGKAVLADEVPELLHRFRHAEFSSRQMQMSLEQRAYQISALYRGNDVAIGFVDVHGMLVDASEAFVRRLGLTQAEAIGRPITDIAAPGLEAVKRFSAGRRPADRHGAVTVTLPSGRTDLMIAHEVDDEAGEPLGLSILAIDITDLRQVQQTLQERQQQFHFIVENCPHVFWSTAPDGRLLFVNPRWQAISGMSDAQVDNGQVVNFIEPAHRDLVMKRWRHCLATGQVHDMDYLHRLADGEMHWVRCWGAPYRNAQGEILAWYGTLSVITPPRPPEAEDSAEGGASPPLDALGE